MKLDKLTQPGWGEAADHFRERDKKDETTEWKVPAIFNLEQQIMQRDQSRRHSVSLWRLLTPSPENCNCRK